MKDAEFIELLNLYLDHEIAATDAARLEAEVQANPARRRVYLEYCQMQKACKLLAQDYQTDAASATDNTVVAFEPGAHSWRGTGFYTASALVAVAAGVAIIFVGRNRENAAAGSNAQPQQVAHENPIVAPAGAPALAIAPIEVASPRMITQTVSIPAPREQVQATLVADPLLLTGKVQADAMLATAVEQANAQFAWMRSVQLAPLQQRAPLEDLRFESRTMTLPDPRALGSRPVAPEDVEMTAFRFMK